MLRMNLIYNTVQAINYYADHLPNDDYYAKDQVINPEWQGELSKKLGLNGEVSIEDYKLIMQNINPATGESLTLLNRENRRAGYDLTFSLPKSLSLEFSLNDNQEVLDIFKRSVEKTMKLIEQEAMTRVRVDGNDYDRITGNLTYVPYFHQFARPEGDGVPDPHLHCHVVVANATYDSAEGKIKALQPDNMFRDSQYFQQVMYNYVAEEMIEKGFKIRCKDWYFELDKYSDDLINKFSNRTKVIEETQAKLGITNKDVASNLGAKTRKAKNNKFSIELIKSNHLERLSEADKIAVQINPKSEDRITINQKIDRAKESVKYSLDKNFERASVLTYKQIMLEAMRDSIEFGVNQKWIDDEFKSSLTKGEILTKEGSKHSLYTTKAYTTKFVKAEELKILEHIKQAKNSAKPLNQDYEILIKNGFILSTEQKEAVDGILKSTDGIMVFTGKAGTGKTTTLKEIQDGINKKGLEVFIFAPTTGAVDTLKKDGFDNANTIQSFLINENTHAKIKNQVVMIDEAGLISVPQMQKVLETATRSNARVILVGDSAQHTSVERGDALRLIESTDITKVNIYSIRRQIGQYRDATQSIAKGEIMDGYEKLDSLGYIKQDKTLPRLYAKASKDYVTSLNKGQTVGLYTPTHETGKAVSKLIRNELIKNGTIDKNSSDYKILRDLNLENAVKSRIDNYESSQKIVLNKAIIGYNKDDIYTVKIDERRKLGDKIVLESPKGEILKVPIHSPESFSVFKQESISLAKGDKIILTSSLNTKENNQTGTQSKLPNGKKLLIQEVKASGDLVVAEDIKPNLDRGIKPKQYVIDKSNQRLNYGYYSTSHKGQGDTVDKAIIVATHKSLTAVNDKQFYVSTTRGRKYVSIYTDNKTEFAKHIQKSGERELALEKVRIPTKSKVISKQIIPQKSNLISITK
jgi:conjugative relaxase-like TrwC/TraI family protein